MQLYYLLFYRLMLSQNTGKMPWEQTCSDSLPRNAPTILFSYGSPNQTPESKISLQKCIETFGKVPSRKTKTHIDFNPDAALKIESGKAELFESKGAKRKKIFDHSRSSIYPDLLSSADNFMSRSEVKRGERMKSAIDYTEHRRRGQKNSIFKEYNPRRNTEVAYDVKDEDGARLFPIHKPMPPKSLVHYIDLAPHRKKKMFQENSTPIKIHCDDTLKVSDFKLNVEPTKDAPSGRNSDNIEKSPFLEYFEEDEIENIPSQKDSVVNFSELLDLSPRFFDRNNEQISSIDNKQPLVDIKLRRSVNMPKLKRTESLLQTPQSYLPVVVEKSLQISGQMVRDKNVLPLFLIGLGILLFLIQVVK